MGWLETFKNRYNLTFKKVYDESASVDLIISLDWKNELTILLVDYYETSQIFLRVFTEFLTIKNEHCHGGKISK